MRSGQVLDTLVRVEVAEGVQHVHGVRQGRLQWHVVAARAGAGVAGIRVPVAVALDADGAVGVLAVTVVAGGAQLTRRT